MGQIQIALEVLPTTHSDKIHIKDASFYDFRSDICKGTLQIKAPGFDWVEFHEEPYFDKYYTTKNLAMQCTSCDDELLSLPDGVWKINFMLGENFNTVVEYYHLRNVAQQKCFNKIRNYILSLEGVLTRRDFEERANELLKIQQRIDAAKWRVEEGGDADGGMLIYKEVNYMLEGYKNECNC